MARRDHDEEEVDDVEEEAEEEIDESPLDSDVDPDEGEEAVIPCPHCGEEIFEEAQRCAHCGKYISKEDAPARPRSSGWVTAILFLLLVAALASVLIFMR